MSFYTWASAHWERCGDHENHCYIITKPTAAMQIAVSSVPKQYIAHIYEIDTCIRSIYIIRHACLYMHAFYFDLLIYSSGK